MLSLLISEGVTVEASGFAVGFGNESILSCNVLFQSVVSSEESTLNPEITIVLSVVNVWDGSEKVTLTSTAVLSFSSKDTEFITKSKELLFSGQPCVNKSILFLSTFETKVCLPLSLIVIFETISSILDSNSFWISSGVETISPLNPLMLNVFVIGSNPPTGSLNLISTSSDEALS